MERLASRADVGPSSPHDEPLDDRGAARARLAGPLEDGQDELARRRLAPASDAVLAGDAAPFGDGAREHGDDRAVEASEARLVERLDPLEGMDPRVVEDLVGVDVADPGDEGGVEEHGLHGTAPSRTALLEDREREAWFERLRTDRVLEGATGLRVDHVEPAEAARILEVEANGPEVDREPRPSARLVAFREDQESPGELEVEDERRPLRVEVDEDELPAPRDRAHRSTQGERRRPAAGARVADDDAPDLLSRDPASEVADDVLDFGELGHGSVGLSC